MSPKIIQHFSWQSLMPMAKPECIYSIIPFFRSSQYLVDDIRWD